MTDLLHLNLKRPALALTLSLVLWVVSASAAPALSSTHSSRADFGRNAYPIWSPLSFFERQTIGERHAAETGDPDALLALYIMASGRHSLDDYKRIKQQIDHYVKTLKDHTDGVLDPWQQGEILNRTMHHSFFRSPEPKDDEDSQSKPPSNYNLDQSQLTGIFQNNLFNCISSSLLYAVLARHLGLEGLGVMLPSHAFIQLNFENGKTAEVETTSPLGYDQHHDAEFYQRAADSWFNPRGLAPSSYNDYLDRELISFWQLGTRNMLHQHTHPGRMNDVNRGRLAEISAFLDPSYEAAQINRMHYYTTEASNMAKHQQWPSLARFFSHVMENLTIDTERFNHNEPLQNSFFWLNLLAIDAYAQTQQLAPTLSYIQQSMNLAFNSERLERAQNKSLSALNTLLKHFVAEQDFNSGLYAINALESYSSEHPHFVKSLNWFYNQWAKALWDQKLWGDATATLEDYLAQPYLPANLKDTHNNLAGAYQNWIIAELELHNLDGAKAITEQCEIQHFGLTLCQKARDEITVYETVNPKKATKAAPAQLPST
ncbi:transglutaminase family protein [Marinagarivorans algicola]|uniref:transglutaminase family protein n=1 Tax=Marinagarivorans algicola TaxID=1513270 RepID=UPI0006B9F26C|nr:transglutaminase family protein [Marinagarivorans algicola]